MNLADPDRSIPVALLERWRGLLSRYGDEAYTQLRSDGEAAVARWVWAAGKSQLHRIEPFARELDALPEPKLLPQAPRPPVNAELYGYDQHDRIVLVRTYGDSGHVWFEEFLLHAPGEITSIKFTSDPPSRLAIRRWRLREGRVRELIEAAGPGTESTSFSLTHYLYAGERVEHVKEEEFDLSSGDRTDDWLTIPTYASDGRVQELRMHETPVWQEEFVVYRRPSEDLPELAAQRAALTQKLTETITEVVISSHPPGRLYGLVLEYGEGGVCPTAAALFEAARRYWLGGGAESHSPEAVADRRDLWHRLWDPTWTEPEDYLPEGVDPAPYDREAMEDDVQRPFEEHPELNRAFDEYQRTGALVDRDDGRSAVDALWWEVAARLTKLDWKGRLDVTDDFVVLACPLEARGDDIRAALKHSLTPARFAEFEAKGWVPGSEDL